MIVNHISRVMGEHRLSIAETARRAGLAYTVVFGLYHGNVKRVDLGTLDALCAALEVESVSDLFEYRRETQGADFEDDAYGNDEPALRVSRNSEGMTRV